MQSRLIFPFAVVGFLNFSFPGYLIFTTFCFIDGPGALVLVASRLPTVSASIFPEDCCEGGHGFR